MSNALSPSNTLAICGGIVSIIAPSDVAVVQSSPTEQAVTEAKYFRPSINRRCETLNSEAKKNNSIDV